MTNAEHKRFHALAVKEALGSATVEEMAELEALDKLRDRPDVPEPDDLAGKTERMLKDAGIEFIHVGGMNPALISALANATLIGSVLFVDYPPRPEPPPIEKIVAEDIKALSYDPPLPPKQHEPFYAGAMKRKRKPR